MLGRGRAHACPPASGHDDGCELGAGFGHGRHVGWGARIRTWDHGTKARCLTTWPRPSESGRRVYPAARSRREVSRLPGRARRSAPVEQEDGQCNRRENGNDDDREDADEQEGERNEHDHELRDRGEPRPCANARRAVVPTDPHVQRHGAGGCGHDEPPGEDADDDEDRLDGRDADGDLQPAAAQTGARAGSRDARR